MMEGDASRWTAEGNALSGQQRYAEALTAFEQALTLDPAHAAAWRGKAIALCYLARFEESLAAYDRALELEPNAAGAWTNRGNVLNHLGRREEALVSHERALALDPGWRNGITRATFCGRWHGTNKPSPPHPMGLQFWMLQHDL